MKILIIVLCLMPFTAFAEIYSWTDEDGVVNFTSDRKNIPGSLKDSIEKPQKPGKPASGNIQNFNENESGFANETIKKISELTRQIDYGIKYADEYYEKNRPVSKSVLISYLNSLSYEISNLKKILESGVLNEETRNSLAARLATFDAKYARYNDIVNDIDTIEVSKFSKNAYLDYKTGRTFDTNNNQIGTIITEENIVFIFTATVTNKGSKADVAVELSALNYNETSVASHIIKTSIGSAQSKEISDRVIMPGVSRDLTWVISDVKISRNRR